MGKVDDLLADRIITRSQLKCSFSNDMENMGIYVGQLRMELEARIAERDALRMAVQQIYGLLDPRMDNRTIAADRCFIIAEQVLAQMERRRNYA